MVVDVVEAGCSVAVAAQGFDAQVEFPRLQGATPLEHHVLEEVGEAGLVRSFHATTGSAPKVQADHRCVWQVQLHQGGSVGELTTLRFRQRCGVQTWQRLEILGLPHSAGRIAQSVVPEP